MSFSTATTLTLEPLTPVPAAIAAAALLSISENERMLRRYVQALSGDASMLDDLCQEVYLRFVQRLNRLESQEKTGQFLRGIARHVVQEHFRHRRRSLRYVQLTAEALVDEGPIGAFDGEDQATIASLREAMGKLPLVSRRMLELRYHDDRSAEEIGHELGIQAGAVRVSLLRIRERLRKCLSRTP